MAQHFEIEFSKHIFVWARPRAGDWSHYDGSTTRQGNEEFRPVLVWGHNEDQSVMVHGSASAYTPEEFQFGGVVVALGDREP